MVLRDKTLDTLEHQLRDARWIRHSVGHDVQDCLGPQRDVVCICLRVLRALPSSSVSRLVDSRGRCVAPTSAISHRLSTAPTVLFKGGKASTDSLSARREVDRISGMISVEVT